LTGREPDAATLDKLTPQLSGVQFAQRLLAHAPVDISTNLLVENELAGRACFSTALLELHSDASRVMRVGNRSCSDTESEE
jgi:hypothetical protein